MLFIRTAFCYNRDMPQQVEKKSEQVLVNVGPSTYEMLVKIGEVEDRKLGYVARELMIRGLNLYRKDGKLRDEQTQTIGVLKGKAK